MHYQMLCALGSFARENAGHRNLRVNRLTNSLLTLGLSVRISNFVGDGGRIACREALGKRLVKPCVEVTLGGLRSRKGNLDR